jgi:hypothetical protein
MARFSAASAHPAAEHHIGTHEPLPSFRSSGFSRSFSSRPATIARSWPAVLRATSSAATSAASWPGRPLAAPTSARVSWPARSPARRRPPGRIRGAGRGSSASSRRPRSSSLALLRLRRGEEEARLRLIRLERQRLRRMRPPPRRITMPPAIRRAPRRDPPRARRSRLQAGSRCGNAVDASSARPSLQIDRRQHVPAAAVVGVLRRDGARRARPVLRPCFPLAAGFARDRASSGCDGRSGEPIKPNRPPAHQRHRQDGRHRSDRAGAAPRPCRRSAGGRGLKAAGCGGRSRPAPARPRPADQAALDIASTSASWSL